jgi:hypothetical protein
MTSSASTTHVGNVPAGVFIFWSRNHARASRRILRSSTKVVFKASIGVVFCEVPSRRNGRTLNSSSALGPLGSIRRTASVNSLISVCRSGSSSIIANEIPRNLREWKGVHFLLRSFANPPSCGAGRWPRVRPCQQSCPSVPRGRVPRGEDLFTGTTEKSPPGVAGNRPKERPDLNAPSS